MKKRMIRAIRVTNILLAVLLAFMGGVVLTDEFAGWKKELKPYVIDFGDNIAIRCLHDGNIDATVEAYERADWEEFKEWGSTWATQYTDEEYRAEMAEYDSINSFAAMQEAGDYVDVSAGAYGTLAAVHADGTVSFNKRAEVRYAASAEDDAWKNVKELELGAYSVLALKNDGTVTAKTKWTMFDFVSGTRPEEWTNIRAISNDFFAVGLREDGTVCWAAPEFETQNPDSFIPPEETALWKELVQLETSWETIAGLRADGTVVLAGDTGNGKADVSSWKDICKIAVGKEFIAGLKKDGTLVCTAPWALERGENLKNVMDVYANRYYVLAVLKNGTARLLGIPEETIHDGSRPAAKWKFPC